MIINFTVSTAQEKQKLCITTILENIAEIKHVLFLL